MAKIKPGKCFPVGVLAKLKNARLEEGVIITDTPCEEVWRILYDEVSFNFRDFIIAYTLVSTAVMLGVAGVFWKTYTVVNNHILPIGIVVLLLSYALSSAIAYLKRKNFLEDLVEECDD